MDATSTDLTAMFGITKMELALWAAIIVLAIYALIVGVKNEILERRVCRLEGEKRGEG